MTSKLEAFARLNDLKITPRRFSPYKLSPAPPVGSANHQWPCADDATCLVDRSGKPAAIVIESLPDHDFRRLGELVRWLKIPYHTPPGARAENERHFLVLTREGLPEPQWIEGLRAPF